MPKSRNTYAEVNALDPATVTPSQMLEEARRELRMRQSAYPKWVDNNRMSMEDAQRQIAVQKAIVAELDSRIQPDLLG